MCVCVHTVRYVRGKSLLSTCGPKEKSKGEEGRKYIGKGRRPIKLQREKQRKVRMCDAVRRREKEFQEIGGEKGNDKNKRKVQK